MIRSVPIRLLVPSAALVLGAAVGIAGAGVALAGDHGSEPGRVDQVVGKVTDWPENAAGLTYGSAADAKAPADEPDLIEAYATNGNQGYVRRTDLESDSPSSPEEALEQQARMAGVTEEIPVYEVDGTTQIGVFILQH